jgi:aspartate aminotransferase-like enzyme
LYDVLVHVSPFSVESFMIKTRLLTPGPTDVPAQVLNEMAKPIIHHRTQEFEAIFAAMTAGLKTIFRTEQDVLTLGGSGTAGMEASIACACRRDRKTLVVNGGKFGERWVKIAKVYGCNVEELAIEWGQAVSPEAISQKVATGDYGAVVLVHSETSTATACDLEAIAEATRKSEALLIVDAITSCGTIPLEMDAWGVDIVATGSQKAFMCPPGLAMVAVSPRAWHVIESIDSPTFYLDLQAYRKALAKNTTPYTGAVSLIRGLKVAVDMVNEIGIERVWSRTALLAKATRAAATAMGLSLASSCPSDSVTAIGLPDGIGDEIRAAMRETYGVSVAGGQEAWKGKVIRLNHMGYVDPLDTIGAIAVLEYTLRDLGYECPIGTGVAAATAVLAEWE